MKPSKTAIFFLFLAMLAVSVFAIELEEFTEPVKASHPFFRKEELAAEVEQNRRETLLPRYEWVYSLMPQYTILDGQISSEYFENLAQTAIGSKVPDSIRRLNVDLQSARMYDKVNSV